MYVFYGTNEYNFAKLENPPDYEPTLCAQCGRVISLGKDGYSVLGSEYLCETCAMAKFRRTLAVKSHR
jgi:hypothetical protein